MPSKQYSSTSRSNQTAPLESDKSPAASTYPCHSRVSQVSREWAKVVEASVRREARAKPINSPASLQESQFGSASTYPSGAIVGNGVFPPLRPWALQLQVMEKVRAGYRCSQVQGQVTPPQQRDPGSVRRGGPPGVGEATVWVVYFVVGREHDQVARVGLDDIVAGGVVRDERNDVERSLGQGGSQERHPRKKGRMAAHGKLGER